MSAGQSLPDVCFEAAGGDPYLALAVAVGAVQQGVWPGLPIYFPAAPKPEPVAPLPKKRHRSTPAELQRRRPIVAKLYADGYGAPTIARLLRVGLRTVQHDLECLGIPRRQTWARSSPAERAARERLEARLYALGFTLVEIGERLGVTESTVWRDLVRCGVARRSGTRPLPTHCPHGHAYDELNTYLAPPNGWRQCRACRERRRRESAARAAA